MSGGDPDIVDDDLLEELNKTAEFRDVKNASLKLEIRKFPESF